MTNKTSLSIAVFIVTLLVSSFCVADVALRSGGVSGQWYNPAREGEGLFVEIVEAGANQQFAVSWFTYDESGNQMWLVGNVVMEGDPTSIVVPVVVTNGPMFGPDYDPSVLNRTSWGTLTLNFPSCTTGLLSYASSVGFGSGAINLSRLTSLTQVQCNEPPPVTGLTPGRWTGSGVCIFVSEDGRSLTPEGSTCDSSRSVDTDIENQMDENGSNCDVEVETRHTIAIIDGSFAYSLNGQSIIGTFTSPTSATGFAQEVEGSTCTGQWTVSPDNP